MNRLKIEINASMVFNLAFSNSNILSCFSLLFLIIDIQSFNPITELTMLRGIAAKEAKAEMETYPVNAEAKISRCSVKFSVI